MLWWYHVFVFFLPYLDKYILNVGLAFYYIGAEAECILLSLKKKCFDARYVSRIALCVTLC
jgi:hypothetical protein